MSMRGFRARSRPRQTPELHSFASARPINRTASRQMRVSSVLMKAGGLPVREETVKGLIGRGVRVFISIPSVSMKIRGRFDEGTWLDRGGAGEDAVRMC